MEFRARHIVFFTAGAQPGSKIRLLFPAFRPRVVALYSFVEPITRCHEVH